MVIVMDNRTINQIRNNETKLINEIKKLEQENKKYKEVIDKLEKYIRLTVSEEEFNALTQFDKPVIISIPSFILFQLNANMRIFFVLPKNPCSKYLYTYVQFHSKMFL